MQADLRNLRFGVEVEVEGINEDEMAECVVAVVGGTWYSDDNVVVGRDGDEWVVKDDSSLRCGGCELASPPMRMDDGLSDLLAILEKLQQAGATVDYHCGLHIHVDAAGFTARRLVNLVNLVFAHEAHIVKALDVDGYRAEHYAKPLEDAVVLRMRERGVTAPSTMNSRDLFQRMGAAPYTRYFGLNFDALRYHGTVEFRYFNGTLDTKRLTAYVHLALALMHYASTKRTVAAKPQKPLVATCEKFDMRCLLIHLGLNGADYKDTRDTLTSHLRGSNNRAVGRTRMPALA